VNLRRTDLLVALNLAIASQYRKERRAWQTYGTSEMFYKSEFLTRLEAAHAAIQRGESVTIEEKK